MATKRYTQAVRSAQLADELLAAFPTWVLTDSAGVRQAQFRVESDTIPVGTWVQVTWPDATPVAEVDAIVAAHKPQTPPVRTLAERRAAKAALVRERAVKEAT